MTLYYSSKNIFILLGILTICMVYNAFRAFRRISKRSSIKNSNVYMDEINRELYNDHNNDGKISQIAKFDKIMGTFESKFKGPGTMWVDEVRPNVFGEGIQAKVYRSWPSDTHPLPCFQPEDDWKNFKRQNTGVVTKGFLFQRPFKCGSTSSIGMVLRFLYKLAKSKGYKKEMCRVRFDHGWFEPKWAKRFKGRIKNKSYLWTILRDPTPRTISQYYFFQISHMRERPTDEGFLKWLQRTKMVEDYYARFLLTDFQYPGRDFTNAVPADIPRLESQYGIVNGTTNVGLKSTQIVLDEYDFIGITERFDESAIVLSMLLKIPLGDLLYLSVKESGGFDYAWNECMYIVKPYVSPKMREYFDSKEWKDRIKYDVALYRAANRSLDLTIERLGVTKFHNTLHRFQNALKKANKDCGDKVLHLCTEGGEVVPRQRHDCLWDNAACGMSCLDEVAKKLKLPMTKVDGDKRIYYRKKERTMPSEK